MTMRAQARVRLCEARSEVAVAFSRHAVERFVERARPAPAVDTAAVQLERIAPGGVITPDRPVWVSGGPFAHMFLLWERIELLGLVDLLEHTRATRPRIATARVGSRAAATSRP